MPMIETLFHCDSALWRGFQAMCQERDQEPGAVLRHLVRLEVKRNAGRRARSDEVIDEQLLVRLRLLVAQALVGSRNWADLHAALRRNGLGLVPAGGGLNLTDLRDAKTLAKASQVGPAYLDLVRRFGTGFPGHPRPGLATQALRRDSAP